MRKSILIFVFGQLNRATQALGEIAEETAETRVIVVDEAKDEGSALHSGETRSLSSYRSRAQEGGQHLAKALQWLDQWNARTQFDKQVTYEGLSLWWFVRFDLVRWLWDLIPDLDAVLFVIAEVSPREIHVINANTYWRGVFEAISHSKGLTVHLHSHFTLREYWETCCDRVRGWLTRVLVVTVWGLRVLQGIGALGMQSVKERRRAVRRKILSLSYNVWRKVTIGDKEYQLDPAIDLVLDRLAAQGFMEIRLKAPTFWGWKGDLLGFREHRYPYVPLEAYFVLWYFLGDKRTLRQESKDFRTRRDTLKQAEAFRVPAFYAGIDIRELLLDKIRELFGNRFLRPIRDVEAFKFILKREQPQLVLAVNEFCGLAMALAAAARNLGIPSVALQHGVIWRWHPGYMYPGDDEGKTIPLYDKTCVFGPYEKELLLKESVYQDSQVEVTGYPRLDLLTHQCVRYNRQRLLAKLGVPPNKKLLLFTSQGPGREVIGPRLLEEFKRSEGDSFLVIKLHPGYERRDGFYEAIVRLKGIRNVKVVHEDFDLYELLWSCDVHLSVTSTVISEAAVFNKPNIMLGTDVFPDTVGYIDRGIAVRLEDFASLQLALVAVLEDSNLREKAAQCRRRFIAHHYYKLDGNAANRVVELVEDTIRTSITGRETGDADEKNQYAKINR